MGWQIPRGRLQTSVMQLRNEERVEPAPQKTKMRRMIKMTKRRVKTLQPRKAMMTKRRRKRIRGRKRSRRRKRRRDALRQMIDGGTVADQGILSRVWRCRNIVACLA